eukprot:2707844-Prorocentrum_lima.AAC.1
MFADLNRTIVIDQSVVLLIILQVGVVRICIGIRFHTLKVSMRRAILSKGAWLIGRCRVGFLLHGRVP